MAWLMTVVVTLNGWTRMPLMKYSALRVGQPAREPGAKQHQPPDRMSNILMSVIYVFCVFMLHELCHLCAVKVVYLVDVVTVFVLFNAQVLLNAHPPFSRFTASNWQQCTWPKRSPNPPNPCCLLTVVNKRTPYHYLRAVRV